MKHEIALKNPGRTLLSVLLLGLVATGSADELRPQHAAPPQDELSGHLLIAGSSTMVPLLAGIAQRFEQQHPGVTVEVKSTGSGRAISDVRDGKVDIGMLSRATADAEQDLFGLAIARDGVAAVVHRDNPVAALTGSQLAAIYTGRIKNWKQLGGTDTTILVVNAPIDCGETDLFVRYLNIAYSDITAQKVIANAGQRLTSVLENPNAIAYASIGEGQRHAQNGAAIALLSLDGEPATGQSIRRGEFPIARPLTLLTKSMPSGLPLAFIEFCLEPETADVFEAFGFVSYLD
jgi:phosphate transport system substrate-binding protein